MSVEVVNRQRKYPVDTELIRRCSEWILREEKRGKAKATVVLTNNRRIRQLNKKFRGENRATDVLSFPWKEKNYLGDVIISIEKIAENAKFYGQEFNDELLRVLIHGFLHLLGEVDEGEVQRENMEKKQENLLMLFKRRIGINWKKSQLSS